MPRKGLGATCDTAMPDHSPCIGLHRLRRAVLAQWRTQNAFHPVPAGQLPGIGQGFLAIGLVSQRDPLHLHSSAAGAALIHAALMPALNMLPTSAHGPVHEDVCPALGSAGRASPLKSSLQRPAQPRPIRLGAGSTLRLLNLRHKLLLVCFLWVAYPSALAPPFAGGLVRAGADITMQAHPITPQE